jgi:hypothetical protein
VRNGTHKVKRKPHPVWMWAWLCLGVAGLVQAGAASVSRDEAVCDGPPKAASLRAEMAEVWGEWTGTEGRVAWRLGASWGTAGFRVYRIDPASGVERQLNETLVPARMFEPDATYAVVDPAATDGGGATYRMEEVELSGEVRDLGTFAVVFGPPPPVEEKPRSIPAPARKPQAVVSGPSDVLKVWVRDEGIYGISLEAIAAGMGISLAAVEGLAAGGALELTVQGMPVPAIHDAARGRIVFHGQPTTNWYTRDAAVLIRAGEGTAMPRREPGATQGIATLPASVRFEQDVFPFNGAIQRPADFYFWNFIISSTNPAANLTDFPIDLEGYAGGDLTLKVDVQGWSQTTRNPDHIAEFHFNGAPLGILTFDDQDRATAVRTVPPGIASNGINVLTVRGVLTNAAHHSSFVLDGITAEYDRVLSPGAGTVHVRAGGAASVSAAAFMDPLALALDEAGLPTWIADESGILPSKAWAALGASERYAVVEADEVPLLAPVPAAADAWFMAESNRVDYLVIAPRALAAAAQELADYRAAEGLRTGVAVFEDVCDLMAGGLRTPEAIPALMRHAAATWAEPPGMMVLAGNGHYDYLESMGPEPNHLPPLLRQTFDGLFSSDEQFADIGGDELPDVAIGRLPARTPEELAAMIAKIRAYEKDFGAAWQNHLVFANDKADGAGNFAESVAQFTNLVAAPYAVSVRVNLDTTAIAPARTAFLGSFDEGAGVVHYTGHGMTAKLALQGLLLAADVAAMTNARTPVVVSLSCLSGYFEAPSVDSLAELLMQREQGGAVAVWASSALALNAPSTDMGETFYRTVLQEGAGRLGVAILKARRAWPGDLFTRNTFATYNLMGDPALRIAGNATGDGIKSPAQVTLQNLAQSYNGEPRKASAATQPAGLAVRFTYDGVSEAPTLPGSYAVTGIVATATYEGTGTGTLVVAKAAATVALGDLNQTYDGSPKSATAVTDPSGLTVNMTYSALTNPPTAPGKYFVVATIDDPVFAGSTTGSLLISKAPAAVVLEGLAQVYDGTPRVVTAATDPAGLPVAIAYNRSSTPPTSAGSHAVVATVVHAYYAGSATGTLVVAKAEATVTLVGLEQTYDGTPRVVTAATEPGELPRDITYNGSFTAPTAAGAYGVTGAVWDPNWQGVATGTLIVAKAGQTTDFPPIADQWTSNIVTLAATASSGLPVSFTVRSGPGVITDGNLLSFMSSGTVSIAAVQVGDENWTEAPEVVRSFDVAYANPIPEISATFVRVRENGEGRLHVRLPSKGSAVISIARIAGSTNMAVQSGATLTFKANNWNVYQTVTLAAANDENADSEVATFRISAPGFSDLLVTATTLDDDIGPNLARASGGATISGNMAANADWAIDGIHTSSAQVASTVWTGAVPGTLTLDLKTTTTLSRIRVMNPDWTPAMQRYRIEGSRDGADWSLLADAGTEDRGGWDEWAVSGVARYLRFTGVSNSESSFVGLAEWEVYGTPWQKTTTLVTLHDLVQNYDGTPRFATATTKPSGLTVDIVYDGSPSPPTAAGTYEVVATIVDDVYVGTATGTLDIESIPQLFERWLQNECGQDPKNPDFAPDEDVDGDGFTTWEEFLADTDPTDSDSALVLTGTYFTADEAGDSTGQIQFSFPASTGRYYQLEYRTDLTQPVAGIAFSGWGTPGPDGRMTITHNAAGTWYGVIRVLLNAP